MAPNADQFLKRMYAGSEIVFKNQVIAEIIKNANGTLDIKDVHGKHWSINLEGLTHTYYKQFIRDLAIAIAKYCPAPAAESSAQCILGAMSIGDNLLNDSGILATLKTVEPDTRLGPRLILVDPDGVQIKIYLKLIPYTFDLNAFTKQFKVLLQEAALAKEQPILLNYFKNEFIPKMLAQMDYDQKRWGDSWLFQPLAGQEESISEHFNEYFDFFEQFGKKVPWLKVSGYAIIAQAREDHPDWLM